MKSARNRMVCLLVLATASLCAVPAAASAEDFVVNTLDDPGGEYCYSLPQGCSLQRAIEEANALSGPHTISFDPAILGGTIVLTEQLPAISSDEITTIDATTESGAPGIEIDGSALPPGAVGLSTTTGGKTQFEGFAIGGFEKGINLRGEPGSVLCRNYIGVDLSGLVATPNEIGVEVGATGDRIGGGVCGEDGGNVISGNSAWGLYTYGTDIDVVANQIGVDAFGDPLPNGDGGVLVSKDAFKTSIGFFPGDEGEAGLGNTIAHNGGPGVLIEDGKRRTGIYGNSIFDNDGLGIQILADGVPAPALTGLATAPGTTTATGTLSGAAASTSYILDFYASSSCDQSGFGEGQTYIGGASAQETDASGNLIFSAANLDQLPPGQAVITATATELNLEGDEEVSEFSQCFSSTSPPPPPPPAAFVPLVQTSGLVPENGETLAAEPKSGTVFIQLPGKKKQTKLKEGQLIPVGAIIDATRGKVTLTSVNRAGETQTAVFYGGKFLVAQKDGAGLVTLKLRGGNFKSCKKGAGKSATASAGKKGRRLWGSGKGKFRTEGSYGSATVRGTIWLTEDRCAGTFFKTKKGVVSVRDFSTSTTVTLPAGKSYLAEK